MNRLTSNFLFILLFSIFSATLQAQTIFFEGFQSGMPAGFTLFDVDLKTPNASTAYIGQTWNVIENFDLAGDSVAASNSWFNPVACCADDWMITSAINLTTNNVLSWDVKSQDALYLESYQVRIGTSPTTVAQSTILYSNTAAASTWSTISVNLQTAGFSNQTVYISFRNISNDKFILLVDDIEVSGSIPAGSCVDTVLYTLQKTTFYDFISLNNSTSAHEASQYFDCPQSIKVSGFEFYAYKLNATGGTTISVTAALYLAGSDSLPTGSALATKTVTIDTNYFGGNLGSLLKKAVFTTPVTMNAAYCLVVTNNSANAVMLGCNDYAGIPPDGAGEWLAGAKIGTTWLNGYDIVIGSDPFDADWLVYPYCSYSPKASFSPSTTTGSVGVPVNWTNTSSGIFGNRMYNFAAYLGLTNLSYTWNYGDGSPVVNAINTSHSYSSGGSYTVSLKDTVFGWTNTCYHDTTGTVTIGTTSANFCGPDTVLYTLQKTTAYNTIAVNNVTSGTDVSQYFEAPQAITVYGFDFYCYKEDATSGITKNVTASLYLAGSDSLPTGSALATVQVTVDTNFYGGTLSLLQKSATFSSPVTVTAPYCLVITNNSSIGVAVICNDYTALPPDGAFEWLSGVNLSGNWLHGYDITVGGFPFNADWLFYPVVSYTLKANFSPLSTTGSIGTPVNWTNSSSAIFASKMYNFLAYLGFTTSSYTWNYGDGSAKQNALNTSHSYASNGIFTVTLTDTLVGWTTDCYADTSGTVTISSCPAPVASFNSSVNGLTVTFTNTSTNSPTSFLWNFGDASTSTQQNPTHIYAAAGTYTVCFTATNSCGSNQVCNPVTPVCSKPVASFSSSVSGLTVSFTDLSTNSPSSWSWSFGDAGTSTQQNPTHIYAAAGTYTVCLTSTNSCGASVQVCNSVNAVCLKPAVSFSSSVSGLTVSFTDLSTNTPTSWSWAFGDASGSTLKNPVHTYSLTGTYTVCLISTNSCGSDTACAPVNLSCPAPSANFNFSTSALTATFTDASTNAPTSWLWNFGDATTSVLQNPSHTYSSSGTYSVCLTATNSCGNSQLCKNVTVSCTAPAANFTSSSGALAVTFTDQTTGSPTSWTWTFGDGNTSTLQNPTNIYSAPGTFTVCLTATNSCTTSTTCKTVIVTCPAPVAGFTTVSTGLSVAFTDGTTGSPSSWAWSFGDGNNAVVQNPTHVYSVPGTFTVCLNTQSTCGSDTLCKTVTVTCTPAAAAFSSSISGLTVNFTDASNGNPSSWNWNFGNGNQSTLQNPSHTFTSAGTYNVCLIITDSCGSDTICQNITVSCPAPVSGFTFTANGGTLTFTDVSTGGATSWLWAFGDGNQSTNQNPVHIYTANGNYSVCLTATSTCGSDTVCQTIPVNLIAVDPGLESGLLLFPNPTSGFLTIQGEFGAETSLRILDAGGREILDFGFIGKPGKVERTVDLGSLAAGTYFAEFRIGENKIIRKVVKE